MGAVERYEARVIVLMLRVMILMVTVRILSLALHVSATPTTGLEVSFMVGSEFNAVQREASCGTQVNNILTVLKFKSRGMSIIINALVTNSSINVTLIMGVMRKTLVLDFISYDNIRVIAMIKGNPECCFLHLGQVKLTIMVLSY